MSKLLPVKYELDVNQPFNLTSYWQSQVLHTCDMYWLKKFFIGSCLFFFLSLLLYQKKAFNAYCSYVFFFQIYFREKAKDQVGCTASGSCSSCSCCHTCTSTWCYHSYLKSSSGGPHHHCHRHKEHSYTCPWQYNEDEINLIVYWKSSFLLPLPRLIIRIRRNLKVMHHIHKTQAHSHSAIDINNIRKCSPLIQIPFTLE